MSRSKKPPSKYEPPVDLAAAKPPRASVLDDVAASTASKRWAFTAEQLADIAEVRAAVDAGQIPRVGVERLARILKLRYDMRWSVPSIMDRIKETP